MPEYKLEYQHATGAVEIARILSQKIEPKALAEVQASCGEGRVGVFEYLKHGGHISEAYVEAKFLAKKTDLPQVVIFKREYFIVDRSGECSGPLAPLCKPTTDSAQDWAATALAYGDSGLFSLANELLPARPSGHYQRR